MQFNNRIEAGRWLALELTGYSGRSDVIVLALQGGGVPIANEVSRSLKAPADILVVRKLHLAGQPEVIVGALTSGGVKVMNEEVVQNLKLTPAQIDQISATGQVELESKEQKFRDDRPFPVLAGKTVIVVDDGITTGASMRVALASVRQQNPARLVMAVPVAPPGVFEHFRSLADEIVCLMTPKDFGVVHDYYREYHSVTDEEIHKLLEWASGRVVTA